VAEIRCCFDIVTKWAQFYPRPRSHFCEEGLENRASVQRNSDGPHDRGRVPWFARRSCACCARAGFVADASFWCREVDHRRVGGRGGCSAGSGSRCGIRRGRGKAFGRAGAVPFRGGIVSASLALRTPLGVAGDLYQQAHEQVPQQHNQQRLALRVELKTHFSPHEGKMFGRVVGVGFHVC